MLPIKVYFSANMKTYSITTGYLKVDELRSVLNETFYLKLADEARQKMQACRAFLEKKMAEPGKRYYGINTGFGSLCDVEIPADQLEQLQENLLLSHACGMGSEVMPEVVKIMMILKMKGLVHGYSGVRPEVVEKLIELFNHQIYPVVWDTGSLGASGDLAPLAHLALPIIGRGSVRYKGELMKAEEAMRKAGVEPLRLKAKEGLALINGTQFMSAWGCWSILESQRVVQLADLTAAISVDAFNCQSEPFHEAVHKVRPFKGQMESAKNVLEFLKGSEIARQPKHNIQDPYSFRCVPQVHGAVRGVIEHVEQVFETEINSVTDNPLIFPEEDKILSGGNFHGEPLALAIDYLGMGMSELASISERRTFQLISGKRGLPPFLIEHSGLNSGLMIPQYTAAAIVSMNKQLATPASVDTITSSDGQEDHVSMGANAAVKCYKIVYNIEKVLAIEFLTAMQALDLRKPLKSSPLIEEIKSQYRKIVPFHDKDRYLYDDIQVTVDFMRGLRLDNT
ncbi:MAG: histidine ammonia-lyase [Chitinophagales bacterium]|nr:MAG: histidine ammonia-lyase [Chitinophagales bacterium]